MCKKIQKSYTEKNRMRSKKNESNFMELEDGNGQVGEVMKSKQGKVRK